MDKENRVVALIDMDCFYCQIEEKYNPELKGKPVAVVQYNPWKGGGVLAVNYIAKAMGVGRYIRGDEARKQCPEIQLAAIPSVRGKADMTRYREAGKEVAKVLQRHTPLFERASIDEAYLDITIPVKQRLDTLDVNTITKAMLPNTFALGYETLDDFISDVWNCNSDSLDFDYVHTKQLLVGAVIVSEIRAAVFNETGYECSAGIAHNKIMAKLVCGMNKPNKQTILPKHCVDVLFESLPIKKVKHMGRKFGDIVCETLNVTKMGELQRFTKQELQAKFDEKNGAWLYNIARGIDLEPVQVRLNPKSIGCCKQFRGKLALTDLDSVRTWLRNLADEIEERLEQDSLECNRTPKQMVLSFSQYVQDRDISSSRSYNFTPDDELTGELFARKALDLFLDSTEGVKAKEREPNRRVRAPVKLLGISVGKFEEHSDKKTKKIKDYFSSASTSNEISNVNSEIKLTKSKTEEKNVNKVEKKDFILKKFFQNNITDSNICKNEIIDQKQADNEVLESSLDKQESFFAKFLKTEQNKNTSDKNTDGIAPGTDDNRQIPPDGDDEEASNDTDYSGSTIDNEINKSISLFEDEPSDADRVSSMRQLLNKSKLLEAIDDNSTTPRMVRPNSNQKEQTQSMFKCSDCGKMIDIKMSGTHADYHLALKLREEERQLVRKEVLDKNKERENIRNQVKQKEETANKNEGTSITSYFEKIDGNIPMETCSECSKRVPLAKFPEHLDFHEAQRLSREINKKITPTNISENNVKRKRKSNSPIKKPKVPCKSLDLFFR
ncbi:DNA polymerase eta [Battus philenor]|uniref:DNA polymerase eta n=1 Tax=Battus philenor TaxID=42288 RepID=UPI0035CED6A8